MGRNCTGGERGGMCVSLVDRPNNFLQTVPTISGYCVCSMVSLHKLTLKLLRRREVERQALHTQRQDTPVLACRARL